MKHLAALCLTLLPGLALAGDLSVTGAMVPLAPPAAKVHAGFLTISNAGADTRSLIGVQAEGYAMAHIHRSEVKDGVATMSMVHQVDIAPGQSVTFEHGGLHLMLMGPEAPAKAGANVSLVLEFANGDTLPVTAKMMKMHHGHGS